MPEIIIETLIHARAEECFDLIRDTRIQTDPLPTIFGDFDLGQTVTFQRKLFGVEQSLTLKITLFERPTCFVDEMTKGSLKSFKHIHEFLFVADGTLMRDTLIWESPFGILGRAADKLFLERHLTQLVLTRNAKLKALAEITQS